MGFVMKNLRLLRPDVWLHTRHIEWKLNCCRIWVKHDFFCNAQDFLAEHILHTNSQQPVFTLTSVSKRTFHSSSILKQNVHSPSQGRSSKEKQNYTDVIDKKKVLAKSPAEQMSNIADVLNCSVEEVTELSTKNKFLYHLHSELLKEKVQLLLSHGVSQSDILKHIRVCYNISLSLLEKRLKVLHELSLLNSQNVRFLQTENKDFDKAVTFLFEKKQALEGFSNLSDYIQHRLDCTADEADRMLSMPPFTNGYTSIKLKTMMDFFLLEAKISPQFLLEHSFLFTFSVTRLRKRLAIMREAGVADPLHMKKIWFYPTKKFNGIFRKYLEAD